MRALPRAGARAHRRSDHGDVRRPPGPRTSTRRRTRDPDVVTFKGGELDLSSELRDELVLAVPLNPLCDDGCRGLCPLCGNNRNLVPCKHAAATPAAPGGLAALGKIKL